MILVSNPVEIGEHLEMNLYFSSRLGLITVRAVGSVVWTDKKEEKGDGHFRLGLNYISISPDNIANLKLLLAMYGEWVDTVGNDIALEA